MATLREPPQPRKRRCDSNSGYPPGVHSDRGTTTRTRDTYAPTVDVCHDNGRTRLCMFLHKIILHPGYQMVFERALDHLVEKVWRDYFMNVRVRATFSEGLHRVSVNYGSAFIPKVTTYRHARYDPVVVPQLCGARTCPSILLVELRRPRHSVSVIVTVSRRSTLR